MSSGAHSGKRRISTCSRVGSSAAALLRNTDRSVVDICLAVGLRSVGSFTTSFGRAYGLTPTAYRAAYPAASAHVRVPTCVLQAYARPPSSRFGEDRRARRD
ncbi:MAG TPA: helix-turn-helix domain-containing protein [Gaiellaceae bacterium]